MNHPLIALLALAFALQVEETDNSSMWIILAVVLVILVFIVVIVGVGLTIFFIARKRSKEKASSAPVASLASEPIASSYSSEAHASAPVGSGVEPSAPYADIPAPVEAGVVEEAAAVAEEEDPDFDPSRTIAISREPVAEVSHGSIRFVSGVLAGLEFNVDPAGSFIGREESLAQIVIADPRISKRHLWIGVRDGAVTIVDQDSRNGTFLNDPRSERITEATLTSGDTVIMGESDVARFEYEA